MAAFQIATWYDTWNQTGLDNLVNGIVPLNLAGRYNLAFFSLVAQSSGGYAPGGAGQFASQVQAQILKQAPTAVVYIGLGSTGIAAAVADNTANNNRSTANIVAWLKANGYSGISIDAEEYAVMQVVPDFVTQLGPSFQAAGLGIAISVPWPGGGPTNLYGAGAVQAFNAYVDVLELQDYSSAGTPIDAPIWISAGIPASKLMGGVSTENGQYLTSLSDTQAWTQYALQNGLQGMFSWRLDNDGTPPGSPEDVGPTFTGAQMIYDTAAGA
mgnify:CR=1 FL=1